MPYKPRHHRMQKMHAEYKRRVGCALCGYNADARALQFDHPNPADKPRTNWGVGGVCCNIKSFLKFLPVLRVLCANCHTIEGHHQRAAGLSTTGRGNKTSRRIHDVAIEHEPTATNQV